MDMIRTLLIAVAAGALLAGCVSDYAYRGGSGDYYYGRPSSYGYGYGAPYSTIGYGYPGGWYGSIGYGYGYGDPYGYYPGYGYYGHYRPYYYYPYYRPHYPHWHRPPHRPERPERPDTDGPVMSGPRPAIRRPVPAPQGASYTRRPARRGDALAVPVRPPGDVVARPRMGSQPMPRPREAAPMRATVPQQPRPASRAPAPPPRMERGDGRESSRRHEE